MKAFGAVLAAGGMLAQALGADLMLSLKGPQIHHGGDLLLSITVTNSKPAPIVFHFPDEAGQVSGWLADHTDELKLIKEGAGEVPRRELAQFKRKKIPSAEYPEHEIPSQTSFTCKIDLRRAFTFPPHESGKYRLDFLGARLAFVLGPVPGLVFSDMATPSRPDLAGTEHAVVRDPKQTNGFLLLARPFNAAFREIYQLDFEPTAITCFKLEHAPWCEDGTVVVLSSAPGLRVLTPGQAYHGSVRSARGAIALLPAPNAPRPTAVQVARNWKDEQTDVCLSWPGAAAEASSTNRVCFRLEKHRIVPIRPQDFETARAKSQDRPAD
jgi:hypothetical protein